jgi:nucleoid-associated protein YejK
LKQENEELVGAINNWAKSEEMLKKENQKLRDEVVSLQRDQAWQTVKNLCSPDEVRAEAEAYKFKFEKLHDLVPKWRRSTMRDCSRHDCAEELEELLK